MNFVTTVIPSRILSRLVVYLKASPMETELTTKCGSTGSSSSLSDLRSSGRPLNAIVGLTEVSGIGIVVGSCGLIETA